MTRRRGDTGTRSVMCPNWSVRGGKPQGSESPIKIYDLMVPDWWAVQAPTILVSPCLPFSASVRLFLTQGGFQRVPLWQVCRPSAARFAPGKRHGLLPLRYDRGLEERPQPAMQPNEKCGGEEMIDDPRRR